VRWDVEFRVGVAFGKVRGDFVCPVLALPKVGWCGRVFVEFGLWDL
jgi:hypothetical protein